MLNYIAGRMLQVNHISLTQFKNYKAQAFDFSHKVIGICGANGTGKTNLLDAIYYLCFTKSYFTATDNNTVSYGERGFRLSGKFLLENTPLRVVAVLRETGKKEFSFNEEIYSRVSRHIGKLPAVIIAPDDVAIITGGSEERRKLFDALLCQLNPEYLQQLMQYNKLLQQRNSLLKQMAEQRSNDLDVLEIIDLQMAAAGAFVYNERCHFMGEFLTSATSHYHTIAKTSETVQLSYESQLHGGAEIENIQKFNGLLKENRNRDLQMQRTTAGIHRDDLKLQLNYQPFKQSASQGQRKSLLFALKLTEFEMLQQHKGFAPILLLDDVFEKLDNGRMTNLLMEVCIEKKGQVFITDTHRDRLELQLQGIGCDYEIIEVSIHG
ncbi:MAG: DNA replication and repair protein RecF [Bacteroidota bacterium]